MSYSAVCVLVIHSSLMSLITSVSCNFRGESVRLSLLMSEEVRLQEETVSYPAKACCNVQSAAHVIPYMLQGTRKCGVFSACCCSDVGFA